jgi:hypothetical protein
MTARLPCRIAQVGLTNATLIWFSVVYRDNESRIASHEKQGKVRLAARERGHGAIKVRHRAFFAEKRQQVVDVRHAMRK